MMADPQRCRLLGRFILRSPGFSLDLLSRLRFPASVAAARRILAGRDTGAPAGAAVFAAELHQRRAELRQIFDDPRVQEALWLSNPDMYESHWPSYRRHWRPDQRPAKIKRLERRLYAYLQRFCAKNDTTSFFGPLNYGEFRGTAAACVPGPERVRRRRAFFAYWAAEQIAGRIAADVAAGVETHPDLVAALPARRLPTRSAGRDGSRCRDLPVPPAVLDPLDFLSDRLSRLPAGRIRDRWLDRLGRLAATTRRFAETPFPERVSMLSKVERELADCLRGPGPTGAADESAGPAAGASADPGATTRRGGDGRMFRDRTVVYEECLGDLTHLRLSTTDHQRLTAAFTPTAELCAEFARRRANDLRDAAATVLQQVSPDLAAVPFPRFAAGWRRRFPVGPPTPRADRLVADLRTLAAAHVDGDGCHLPPEVVGSWCVTEGEAVVMSPDLLLAARDLAALAAGDYLPVLGEVHHGVTPLGWMLALADDPAAWHRAVAGLLPVAAADQPAAAEPANLILGRRMKVAPPELPGPSVAAGGVSVSEHQIHLADLVVTAGPGGPELRAPGRSRPLRFYPPSYGVPESYALFAAFSFPLAAAPPVQLGRDTPRITLGDLVYQRRRWRFPAGELPGRYRGSSFDQLLAYTAFQQRAGLPERVYVRAATEPKPIYVDFESFFALELLAEITAGGGEITFEEALPAAGQCWLRRPDGRYPAELRTVCAVAPRPAPGQVSAA